MNARTDIAQVKAAGADWAPTGFQHPARRKEDVALPDEPGWSWCQDWQVTRLRRMPHATRNQASTQPCGPIPLFPFLSLNLSE